jgi:arylsulfatase
MQALFAMEAEATAPADRRPVCRESSTRHGKSARSDAGRKTLTVYAGHRNNGERLHQREEPVGDRLTADVAIPAAGANGVILWGGCFGGWSLRHDGSIGLTTTGSACTSTRSTAAKLAPGKYATISISPMTATVEAGGTATIVNDRKVGTGRVEHQR